MFPSWGLMDRPHRYGLTRKSIPYYGGLVIFLSFLIAVILFVPITKAVIGLLIGATLIAILGFLDDLLGISPFVRLFVQLLAALVLVFSGIGIYSINFPFFGVLNFSGVVVGGVLVLSAIFTVLWVMTIVNVMNFVDGVSGLTSGVAFVSGMTIFLLSINPTLHADISSQVGVATIALILSMTGLAFLIFDFPKPKILMGDTGSTFLGFVIATLAIFSGGKVATAFLVLGIPILDMIWVVLRRIFSGQKFWKGDLKHLHHRLMDIGFSERQVVILYLFITAFFGITAVLLVSSQQKFFMIISLAVLMLLLAIALVLVPRGRRKL
ncbi:MAG: MraY family glycosyltransferase [bacterium]|nr:MraY family glycosyltransferase [bacterium]